MFGRRSQRHTRLKMQQNGETNGIGTTAAADGQFIFAEKRHKKPLTVVCKANGLLESGRKKWPVIGQCRGLATASYSIDVTHKQNAKIKL